MKTQTKTIKALLLAGIFLLVAIFAFTLAPQTAMAEEPVATYVNDSMTINIYADGSTNDGAGAGTWQALSVDAQNGTLQVDGEDINADYDGYMLERGNYYLAGDINISEQLYINQDVNLVLNGHNIGSSEKNAILIYDAELNLYDEQYNSGNISGIINVYARNSVCTFTILGGKISGNINIGEATVEGDSGDMPPMTLNIKGGVIAEGCEIQLFRGEISVSGSPTIYGDIYIGESNRYVGSLNISGGEFTETSSIIFRGEKLSISGSPTINFGSNIEVNSDQSSSTGCIFSITGTPAIQSPIWLDDGVTIDVGTLSNTTKIPVRTFTDPTDDNPVQFATNATADDVQYFSSADGYAVAFNSEDNSLELKLPTKVATFLDADGKEVEIFDGGTAKYAAGVTGTLEGGLATGWQALSAGGEIGDNSKISNYYLATTSQQQRQLTSQALSTLP